MLSEEEYLRRRHAGSSALRDKDPSYAPFPTFVFICKQINLPHAVLHVLVYRADDCCLLRGHPSCADKKKKKKKEAKDQLTS